MALPRKVQLRFTGLAGPAIVYDISSFVTAVPPCGWMTRAWPDYQTLQVEHRMLDWSRQEDRIGYDVNVYLDFLYAPGSTLDTKLSEIAQRIKDPDQIIDLTLDADSAAPTWRRGYFHQWQRDQDGGKNAVISLKSVFFCEVILQQGTVGPLTQPGQPGYYDIPGPPVAGCW